MFWRLSSFCLVFFTRSLVRLSQRRVRIVRWGLYETYVRNKGDFIEHARRHRAVWIDLEVQTVSNYIEAVPEEIQFERGKRKTDLIRLKGNIAVLESKITTCGIKSACKRLYLVGTMLHLDLFIFL